MADTPKAPKQKIIDQTIEDSFPASDPPSTMQADNHPEQLLRDKKAQSKGRPEDMQKEYSKDDFIGKNG